MACIGGTRSCCGRRTARGPAPSWRLLTFEPHPRELFRPDDPPFRLTLAAERAEALAGLGVQILYEIPFDRAFQTDRGASSWSRCCIAGSGRRIWPAGRTSRSGTGGAATWAILAERAEALGIGLTVVPKLADEQGPISSTRIRRLLQDGYPERAALDLGRDWAVRGVVAHGDKRGRTIGFPTANLALGRTSRAGAGRVCGDGAAAGRGPSCRGWRISGGGRRSTRGSESRVEAHLFDWEGDLYGQEIAVALHELSCGRSGSSASFDELRAQIAADAAQARAMLL